MCVRREDVCAGVHLHGFGRRSWRDEGLARRTMLLVDVTHGSSTVLPGAVVVSGGR